MAAENRPSRLAGAVLIKAELLLSAGDLGGDLSGEVVGLLLDAFTLDIVNGVNEGDVAEDFKKAADENLVTALDHSTFTLKEKQAFFKKKWRREHLSTFIFCAIAWLVLMVILRIRHVEPELCGTVGGMLAILYYAVLNNRMMAYVERQLYPLPHEAPSRRSGAP